MHVTSSAVVLTVDDVTASSRFFTEHLGFREDKAADGFASLRRDDTAIEVMFMQRGIEVLPEDQRDLRASGVVVALVVEDLAVEEKRLRAEGVTISLPLREEEWGERLFQITDPNGVVVELVEWSAAAN